MSTEPLRSHAGGASAGAGPLTVAEPVEPVGEDHGSESSDAITTASRDSDSLLTPGEATAVGAQAQDRAGTQAQAGAQAQAHTDGGYALPEEARCLLCREILIDPVVLPCDPRHRLCGPW
jgi:hypothetical protein